MPDDAYSYAIGGLGTPLAPPAWAPPPHVRIEHIGAERTLDQLLGAREIDAILAPVSA